VGIDAARMQLVAVSLSRKSDKTQAKPRQNQSKIKG
jgi:hypothetical protein